MDSQIVKAQKLFNDEPSVQLAYFFGSRARGDFGKNSDYDFAVYLSKTNNLSLFDTKLKLLGKLMQRLETDNVDLVLLNTSDKPELNYQIILDGKIIKETEPTKLLVEPKILNSYFDFVSNLRKYNLTKS